MMSDRYYLFAGQYYYAQGGAHDLIASSDSIDDLNKQIPNEDDCADDWWHIYDSETKEIVSRSECQAHGAE